MDATYLSSLLFVSANTPARFAKALDADADTVCLDLEDSVPAADKGRARDHALAALAQSDRLSLRVNPTGSVEGLRDILSLAESGAKPALLLLPKVESAAEIRIVASLLPDQPLVPLIETPAGLRHAPSIAAETSVGAMMFGGGDMAAELGVDLAWEPLLPARGAFLLACAEARKPAIDVPYVQLDNAAGLERETRQAKELGFQVKAAIHPAQLSAINTALRPSESETIEAREAVSAFDGSGGSAVRFKGRMLEEPLMRRFRSIIAKSDFLRSKYDA